MNLLKKWNKEIIMIKLLIIGYNLLIELFDYLFYILYNKNLWYLIYYLIN